MKALQINVISLLTEETKPSSPVKLVNKLYIVDTCPVYMYVVAIHTYLHTYIHTYITFIKVSSHSNAYWH